MSNVLRPKAGCQNVLIVLLAGFFALPVISFARQPQEQLRALTGHVFGSEDQPLEKAIVYLKNTKTLAVKTYITDPDGSYRFSALSPNADYEVYAEFNGFRSDTKTVSAFDSRKQVNISLRIHTNRK